MVAGGGLAPPCMAYEARLELSPVEPAMVESWGLEPQSSLCRSDILPLNDDPVKELLVGDTDGLDSVSRARMRRLPDLRRVQSAVRSCSS